MLTQNPEQSSTKTKAQELDISGMSDKDLESLRKRDPFLYYSVPENRLAAMCGTDVKSSSSDCTCRSDARGDSESWYSSVSTSESSSSTTTIQRKTRISFEADALCLMVDMMGFDDDDDDPDADECDDGDYDANKMNNQARTPSDSFMGMLQELSQIWKTSCVLIMYN